MSMASLGWAVWWTTLVILRFAPETHLDLRVIEWTAGTIAALGFLAALWCFRAKLAWLLIMSIALFANGSLLMMPWIVDSLRAPNLAHSAEHSER